MRRSADNAHGEAGRVGRTDISGFGLDCTTVRTYVFERFPKYGGTIETEANDTYTCAKTRCWEVVERFAVLQCFLMT